MRPRAAWRTRPDDPKSSLGWLLRDLRGPTRFVATRIVWIMWVAIAALLASGRWVPAGFLWALTSIPDGLLEERRRRLFLIPPPRPLPVCDLVTLPAPATPFPCRIEVSKNGTLLGSDVGVVTFVDGWLHVEGHRASFTLRRPDVAQRKENRLVLAEGGEVTFTPHDLLVAGEHTEAGLIARFEANLGSWMRSDPPEGDSILPPASVHSTGLVRARANLAASLVVGGLLTLLAALCLRHVAAGVVAFSFAVGLFVASRDLRRVRRNAIAAPTRPVLE